MEECSMIPGRPTWVEREGPESERGGSWGEVGEGGRRTILCCRSSSRSLSLEILTTGDALPSVFGGGIKKSSIRREDTPEVGRRCGWEAERVC